MVRVHVTDPYSFHLYFKYIVFSGSFYTLIVANEEQKNPVERYEERHLISNNKFCIPYGGWCNCTEPNDPMSVRLATSRRTLSCIKPIPLLTMLRLFFWIAQHNFFNVSQSVSEFIVSPRGKSIILFPFQIPVHMILRAEIVCLNNTSLGDYGCCHFTNCCLDSGET